MRYHSQWPVGRESWSWVSTVLESVRIDNIAHLPCFPVKPWNMTLVSLFMRRFSAVEAYPEVAVEYLCLLAAAWMRPAERRLNACIATIQR